MEICLIIIAIILIVISGVLVFFSSCIKTLQNHALKATDAIVNMHERVNLLERSAIRKAKRDFDKKKKKIREE